MSHRARPVVSNALAGIAVITLAIVLVGHKHGWWARLRQWAHERSLNRAHAEGRAIPGYQGVGTVAVHMPAPPPENPTARLRRLPECSGASTLHLRPGESRSVLGQEGCWSGWIDASAGGGYEISPSTSEALQIQFSDDGAIFEVALGRPASYGNRRGIFRVTGRGSAVVRTFTRDRDLGTGGRSGRLTEESASRADRQVAERLAALRRDLPWTPGEEWWSVALRNKEVVVHSTLSGTDKAAEIIYRLELLGARSRYEYVSDVPEGKVGEIFYAYADFRAAQAIQAATIDILRFGITREGTTITVWVR